MFCFFICFTDYRLKKVQVWARYSIHLNPKLTQSFWLKQTLNLFYNVAKKIIIGRINARFIDNIKKKIKF